MYHSVPSRRRTALPMQGLHSMGAITSYYRLPTYVCVFDSTKRTARQVCDPDVGYRWKSGTTFPSSKWEPYRITAQDVSRGLFNPCAIADQDFQICGQIERAPTQSSQPEPPRPSPPPAPPPPSPPPAPPAPPPTETTPTVVVTTSEPTPPPTYIEPYADEPTEVFVAEPMFDPGPPEEVVVEEETDNTKLLMVGGVLALVAGGGLAYYLVSKKKRRRRR